MVSFILPGNSATGGYEVANSLRFNNDDNAELSKTPSSDGNRRKWTFSCWVKRSQISSTHEYLLSATGETTVYFRGEILTTELYDGNNYYIRTNRVFRDPSAWYHIVCVWDTENSTQANRMRLYVNNVEETSFSASVYPTQNYDSYMNKDGNTIRIGSYVNDNDGKNFDGYMAEVVLVDGQALTPSSFGEFDEDSPTIWKPIDVSTLSLGTNGFYLDFEDSSNLGNDKSGGTDFTVTNLAATDQTTDTCTNNFATMNPLDNYYSNSTFSEGNCNVTTDTTNQAHTMSTIGVSSGKWYAEVKWTSQPSGLGYAMIGISSQSATGNNELGHNAHDYAYVSGTGQYRNNDSYTSYGSTFTVGDIIGIALNLDDNELTFYKNGTVQNSGTAISITAPSSTPSGFYHFALSDFGSNSTELEINFGNPSFSISSGNSDGRGYGNFEYSVPSGYYSLNSKNLAEFG